MSKLSSKITFKSVVGVPEMTAVKFQDESGIEKTAMRGVEREYMRVVGVVRGFEVKTSQYGDSVEFKGPFRAVNVLTGEVSNAGKLFLPNIAESYVFNAFSSHSEQEGFTGLEVAFDIGIKPAATPAGYEYTVKPLIEQKEPDALDMLMGTLPPLKLAAPEQKPNKKHKKAPATQTGRTRTKAE